MEVSEEMYLALTRGILEAQELRPVSVETGPAMERLNRAMQEAEALWMDGAGR